MKKENISQRTLMEVLTKEIETLKTATQKINEVAPAVSRKLEEFRNMELTANLNQSQINEIEAIFERYLPELDKKVARSTTLPKWLIISLLIAFFSLATSVGFNIHQRNKFNDMKETAQYWYDTAVEHGYKTKN